MDTGLEPSWPIPSELKWQCVNGYPKAYRDAGSGTPIVLVHGLANDYRAWNAQFDAFSSTYRVIAVSLRHFYPERWDGIGSDFSIRQHAEDVVALIEQLELGKVHLVGHSRGGAVAVELAKLRPQVIRTLVLPDGSITMPVADTADATEAAAFSITLLGTLQENLKRGDPTRAAEVFVDMLSVPGAWRTLPEPVQEMILANINTGLAGTDRPLTSCADVKKFDFPIMLLTGEKSPPRFEFFFNEMRKCKEIPASIVIPNAGHLMQRANPKAFNKAVLAFVSAH